MVVLILTSLGLSPPEPAASLPGPSHGTTTRSPLRPLAAESAALNEAKRARALGAAGELEDAIVAAQHALDLAKREFRHDDPVLAIILVISQRCISASIVWTRLWTTAGVR